MSTALVNWGHCNINVLPKLPLRTFCWFCKRPSCFSTLVIHNPDNRAKPPKHKQVNITGVRITGNHNTLPEDSTEATDCNGHSARYCVETTAGTGATAREVSTNIVSFTTQRKCLVHQYTDRSTNRPIGVQSSPVGE